MIPIPTFQVVQGRKEGIRNGREWMIEPVLTSQQLTYSEFGVI